MVEVVGGLWLEAALQILLFAWHMFDYESTLNLTNDQVT